jgi:N utilization substance protein A
MQMDLKQVLETVEKETSIDRQLLINALKEALLTAAKKFHGDCSFEAKFNEDTREFELYKYRLVVEDASLTNVLREIPYSEALRMDESLQVGDEVGEALPNEQLGRIAAQSARQVVMQKMVDADKERIVRDFKEKKGQLVNGIVRRFDKSDLIVDLGSCEGVLPVREQIPNEKYKIRDKISCYVLEVKKSTRGPQVVLSRADPEMLVRLFEQEVAEIAEGIVVIQSAARDPGSRSKIAVFSNESSVDPVGACVGIKGARVQAIVQELRGEKIDIILFDRDPARFVCNALAPAEVTKVIVNERMHTMEVVVPDDMLSLAIGKRGQNVRLAAQLTGWKVDIRSESKMKELMQEHKNVVAQIPSLGEMRAEILVNEGYKDPADIARMEPKALMRLLRLSQEEAETVIAGAQDLASKVTRGAEDELGEVSAFFDPLEIDAALGNGTEYSEQASDDERELQNIVEKARLRPLQDPERVDVRSVPTEVLSFWMKVRGVGEHIAAVLHLGGFAEYQGVLDAKPEDLAHKTGLPLKLVGKLRDEVTKKVSL